MIQKKVLSILLVISFLSSNKLTGQNKSPYIVDSTIKKIIDDNIKLPNFPVSSTMKSTVTINDSTLQENYGLGDNLPAITKAALSNDTIFITTILMARKASFGYKITLTSENYTVKYFSLADENIFKIAKSDKPTYLISVACPTNKLTLTQNPQLKVNNLIEGIIDLTTDDFWSTSDGQDTKIKTHLTGYFKANLSLFQPDTKDIFKQIP